MNTGTTINNNNDNDNDNNEFEHTKFDIEEERDIKATAQNRTTIDLPTEEKEIIEDREGKNGKDKEEDNGTENKTSIATKKISSTVTPKPHIPRYGDTYGIRTLRPDCLWFGVLLGVGG